MGNYYDDQTILNLYNEKYLSIVYTIAKVLKLSQVKYHILKKTNLFMMKLTSFFFIMIF